MTHSGPKRHIDVPPLCFYVHHSLAWKAVGDLWAYHPSLRDQPGSHLLWSLLQKFLSWGLPRPLLSIIHSVFIILVYHLTSYHVMCCIGQGPSRKHIQIGIIWGAFDKRTILQRWKKAIGKLQPATVNPKSGNRGSYRHSQALKVWEEVTGVPNGAQHREGYVFFSCVIMGVFQITDSW